MRSLLKGADDLVQQFSDRAQKGGKLEDVAGEVVATWVNMDRLKGTKTANGYVKFLNSRNEATNEGGAGVAVAKPADSSPVLQTSSRGAPKIDRARL